MNNPLGTASAEGLRRVRHGNVRDVTQGRRSSSLFALGVSKDTAAPARPSTNHGPTTSEPAIAPEERRNHTGRRGTPAEAVMGDGWVSLLELLPARSSNEPRFRQEVASRLRAQTLRISPGGFDMGAIEPGAPGWAALLVLDGLLVAELDAGRAHVGWLLGADDLVCPWELEAGLTRDAAWRALVPTRVAMLDADFAHRAAPVPGVMSELLFRLQRTSRWLLSKSLLVSSPVIEERVLFLFALLGERWGRVTPDGVRLELRLTHALIAHLVGARRPTVTATVNALRHKGIVKRDADGWLLCRGDTAGRSSSWQKYADALGCW
jgi:CRP/FNR family transcriptional regulator, cyclic AMP receptor protein